MHCSFKWHIDANIVQLVVRLLAMQKVVGSSPVIRSITHCGVDWRWFQLGLISRTTRVRVPLPQQNEKWVMYWMCCVNNCLLSSATYRYTSTDGDRYSSLCNEVRFLGDSHDVEITTLVIAEYWIVGTLVKAKWILRTPRASSTLASSATQGDAYSYTQVPQF